MSKIEIIAYAIFGFAMYINTLRIWLDYTEQIESLETECLEEETEESEGEENED